MGRIGYIWSIDDKKEEVKIMAWKHNYESYNGGI